MPYLIIGIDPGSTIGVAALGLDGKPLHASHIENGGLNAAVSLIERWGTPSMVATDVKPAPEMARRLAASFNVPLFVPAHPWREDDKRALMRQLEQNSSFPYENAHERDALSAAMQAWRANQNLLRAARTGAASLAPLERERLLHLLLNGYRHEFALEKMREESVGAREEERGRAREESGTGGSGTGKSRQEERAPNARTPKNRPSPASTVETNTRVQTLERANAELRKSVGRLEQERDGLLHRIRLLENGVRARFQGEMEYRRMRQRIERLEKQNAYEHHINSHLRKKLGRSGVGERPGREPQSSPAKPRNLEKRKPAGGEIDQKGAEANEETGREGAASPRQDDEGADRGGVGADGKDGANLKGLDSFAMLEGLVRQYRRNRAAKNAKD